MKTRSFNATVNGADGSAGARLALAAARFARIMFRVSREPATTTKAEVDIAAAIVQVKVDCRAEFVCDGGLVTEAVPKPAIVDRTTINGVRPGRSGSKPARIKNIPFPLLHSGNTPASRLRISGLGTGTTGTGALSVAISGGTLCRTVMTSR